MPPTKAVTLSPAYTIESSIPTVKAEASFCLRTQKTMLPTSTSTTSRWPALPAKHRVLPETINSLLDPKSTGTLFKRDVKNLYAKGKSVLKSKLNSLVGKRMNTPSEPADADVDNRPAATPKGSAPLEINNTFNANNAAATVALTSNINTQTEPGAGSHDVCTPGTITILSSASAFTRVANELDIPGLAMACSIIFQCPESETFYDCLTRRLKLWYIARRKVVQETQDQRKLLGIYKVLKMAIECCSSNPDLLKFGKIKPGPWMDEHLVGILKYAFYTKNEDFIRSLGLQMEDIGRMTPRVQGHRVDSAHSNTVPVRNNTLGEFADALSPQNAAALCLWAALFVALSQPHSDRADKLAEDLVRQICATSTPSARLARFGLSHLRFPLEETLLFRGLRNLFYPDYDQLFR